MRRVDIYSRIWRWIISFGTQYILFFLSLLIVFLYIRYESVAATSSPQINMDHHHFLLCIQWYGIYCMQTWSVTSTNTIPNCTYDWHWYDKISCPQSSSQFYCRLYYWWEHTWHCQSQMKWCALALCYIDYMQAHMNMLLHPLSPPLLMLLSICPVFICPSLRAE